MSILWLLRITAPRFLPREFTRKSGYMEKEEKIEFEGTITKALPNAMFMVEIENNHEVLAYVSGKMRTRFIRILPGDRVKLEISPYDLTKGRITYRLKK